MRKKEKTIRENSNYNEHNSHENKIYTTVQEEILAPNTTFKLKRKQYHNRLKYFNQTVHVIVKYFISAREGTQ